MTYQPRPMTDADRQRISPSGLRTYAGIAARLALSDDEAAAALGMPPDAYQASLAAALANEPISLAEPALLAISHIFNLVDTALWIAAPCEAEWIRQPSRILDGERPIDCMTRGLDQLIALRQLIESRAADFVLEIKDAPHRAQ